MDYSLNINNSLPPKGTRIDPLANAKGVERLCELCKQPARLQCPKCRVTFYCNEDHQKVDWTGIHDQICSMLIPLRANLPPPTSEQERLQRCEQINYRQKQMAELCRSVAEQKIIEKRFKDSIPACLQLLRVSISIHGGSSVQLVPAYLLLGQASIGLSQFDRAEEYLCEAQWTISKSESCPTEIKFQLSRSLGILYKARDSFEFAVKEFSDMVYYAYNLYGIDSMQVASGYFYIADLYLNKGDCPVAISLYKQVIDIWHQELTLLFASKKFSAKNLNYDDVSITEARDNLTKIFEVSNKYKTNFLNEIPRILHCLTCLLILSNDLLKAKEFNCIAIEATAEINDSEYMEFLKNFQQKM